MTMDSLWTKLDRKDKSTWPDNNEVVFIANDGKKKGTYNLGVGQAWYSRDCLHTWQFWKWEDVIFFRGSRFDVGYWRPLINQDFPDCNTGEEEEI
jgi:hypothetical protein